MQSAEPSRIRRQVYALAPADLQETPAWEFALDEEDAPGQDEATVRPCRKIPVDPGDGMLVVRATFTLADGSQVPGYVSPQPPDAENGLAVQQPTMVAASGQVPLWFGIIPPSRDVLLGYFAALGKQPADVFPLRYATDVEVVGGPVSGTVTGFMFLNRGKIETIPL